MPSTIVLGTSKDNTLYSESGALSNGAGVYFFAGELGTTGHSAIRRGVIAFDIADSIPAGSTINSVTLTLHVSRTAPSFAALTVELHRLLADWGEGTSDAGTPGGMGAPATTASGQKPLTTGSPKRPQSDASRPMSNVRFLEASVGPSQFRLELNATSDDASRWLKMA